MRKQEMELWDRWNAISGIIIPRIPRFLLSLTDMCVTFPK